MSVKVDLSEFKKAGKGACKIARIAEALSEEDFTKFNAALGEKTISVESICKWLTEKTGEQTKGPTMRNHRLGLCSCE